MSYSNESSEKKEPEAEEGKEPENRKDITYWRAWIKSARNNPKPKRHRKEARAAWDEYEKEDKENDGTSRSSAAIERSYPIYWASSKTIEPAYYARQPEPRAKRRFGLKDVPSMVASLAGERLADHLIENCHYDETMVKGTGDFIHADKATVQVLVEATSETQEPQRVDLAMMQGEDGSQQFLDPTGAPWPGEVLQDEIGYFSTTPGGTVPGEPRVYLAPAVYDEVLHTHDAKCESEITEKAFYFCMNRDKAESRFSPEVIEKISWKKTKTNKDEDESSDSKQQDTPGEYIEGWEIWCKDTKKVYFVSPECYPEDVLDVKDDPYKLRGFFPCTPFIIGSPPSKHLYPTPPHEHLRKTIEQLHKAYNKTIELYDGVRRRCLVDGSCPELLAAFSDLEDQEFITVENLSSLIEKGGIQNMIWYLPVQELVQAITELTQLDAQFRNNFNEWFGVPDVLRGVVDPLVTASADRLASGAAHDRFRYQKALVQRMARDAIELMLDLALKVYSDARIAQIVGFNYMTPEQQAAFPQALAILRNDEERLVRIDIKTDSTSFVNEQQENQERNTISQSVVNGLKEVSAMLKNESPQYAAIALHAVMHNLEGLKGGEDFAEEIKGATDQLIQQAMQPPPPAPPPPDYEQMKIQLQQTKISMDQQVKNRELDQKQFKIQLDQQQSGFENSMALREAALNERMEQAYELIEAQKLRLEEISIQLSEREKLIEEVRLQREEMENTFKQHVETAKATSAPPVNVNTGPVTIGPTPEPAPPPRVKRIRGRAVKQADGSWESETMEIPEELSL